MSENVLDKFRRLTVGAFSKRREAAPVNPQIIASERRSFKPKAEIKNGVAIPYDEREEFDRETGTTKVIRRPIGDVEGHAYDFRKRQGGRKKRGG